MAGTVEGGLKAAAHNKKIYGEDFYKKIGAKGGASGTTGGFYYSKVNNLDIHITAGAKGGRNSKPYSIHPK